MNILETTKHILNEGLSSKLYHGIRVGVLIDSLKSNKKALSRTAHSELANQAILSKKYPFYMSLTRSNTSGFIRYWVNKKDKQYAILELDGEKLAQNFKGKPVNWYGDVSDREKKDFYTTATTDIGPKDYLLIKNIRIDDEMEDRLYSNKSHLNDFKRYIVAIHHREMNKKLMYYIKKNAGNIPIYIYDNNVDFIKLNKNKARKA